MRWRRIHTMSTTRYYFRPFMIAVFAILLTSASAFAQVQDTQATVDELSQQVEELRAAQILVHVDFTITKFWALVAALIIGLPVFFLLGKRSKTVASMFFIAALLGSASLANAQIGPPPAEPAITAPAAPAAPPTVAPVPPPPAVRRNTPAPAPAATEPITEADTARAFRELEEENRALKASQGYGGWTLLFVLLIGVGLGIWVEYHHRLTQAARAAALRATPGPRVVPMFLLALLIPGLLQAQSITGATGTIIKGYGPQDFTVRGTRLNDAASLKAVKLDTSGNPTSDIAGLTYTAFDRVNVGRVTVKVTANATAPAEPVSFCLYKADGSKLACSRGTVTMRVMDPQVADIRDEVIKLNSANAAQLKKVAARVEEIAGQMTAMRMEIGGKANASDVPTSAQVKNLADRMDIAETNIKNLNLTDQRVAAALESINEDTKRLNNSVTQTREGVGAVAGAVVDMSDRKTGGILGIGRNKILSDEQRDAMVAKLAAKGIFVEKD